MQGGLQKETLQNLDCGVWTGPWTRLFSLKLAIWPLVGLLEYVQAGIVQT